MIIAGAEAKSLYMEPQPESEI